MRGLRRKWRELSVKKKVASAAAAPLVVAVVGALVGGVIAPIVKNWLEAKPSPKVFRAELRKVTVDTGVTLAEYTARHTTASIAPNSSVAQEGSGEAAVLVAATQPEGIAQAPPADRDGDGVADAQDACPDQSAGTPNGCPERERDRDGDGVPDARDACPGESAATHNGCPERDRDGDGVADAADTCPDQPGTTATGCPQRPIGPVDQVGRTFDTGPCTARALTGETPGGHCGEPKGAIQLLIQGVDSNDPGGDKKDDAAATARAMLAVLHGSRAHRSSAGGRLEPVGVTVSFEVTLKGFAGHRVDVRWSLYHAQGGGGVPRDWLVNRRVLRLEGERDSDTASADFWVPLPKLPGPFFVRLGVHREGGSELTFARTKTFR